MDSRNHTPRNEKQEELIRRLEEIRKARSAEASNDVQKNTSEELSSGEAEPRRNAQRNRKTARSSRNSQTNSVPEVQRRRTKEIEEYCAETTIEQKEIRDEIQATDQVGVQNRPKKNCSKPLLDQLSDGEKLAQAIILNEVLSKPIALRYKNR